jgi:cyclopropane-fatty-acyl-phospholipid synthase
MIEAVGEEYWPVFFAKLSETLAPGGRAALQAITIDDTLFPRYRRGADFIQKYVFPGGMLLSPTALKREGERAGLAWLGAEGFGAHYADTLAVWRRRFLAAWDRIAALGFDDRFKRLWTYYLAYCEGGFRAGNIDVRQVAFAKP